MAESTKKDTAALKVHHLRPGAGCQDRQDPRRSR